MQTIEMNIKKGSDRTKIFTTLKMLRDGGLLISVTQIFIHNGWLLIAKYNG